MPIVSCVAAAAQIAQAESDRCDRKSVAADDSLDEHVQRQLWSSPVDFEQDGIVLLLVILSP